MQDKLCKCTLINSRGKCDCMVGQMEEGGGGIDCVSISNANF